MNWLEFYGQVKEHWAVIRPEHFVFAAVLVELHIASSVLLLEENSVCKRSALLFFVDVDWILMVVALVGWVEFDRQFIVERKPFLQNSSIVALVKSLKLILWFKDLFNVLGEGALEPEISVPQDPVVMRCRIAFKFVVLFGRSDFSNDAGHHLASSVQFISAADQVHIDKAKDFVEELELE